MKIYKCDRCGREIPDYEPVIWYTTEHEGELIPICEKCDGELDNAEDDDL